MARWNIEQPKFEDKDAILAANVGVFVKKRPCHSQAFQLHPSTLLSLSKPIWSPPANLACRETGSCFVKQGVVQKDLQGIGLH
jgi:hypothetical protein